MKLKRNKAKEDFTPTGIDIDNLPAASSSVVTHKKFFLFRPLKLKLLHKITKDHDPRLFIFAILLIVTAGVGATVWITSWVMPIANSSFVIPQKPKPKVYYSPLTGNIIPDEAASKKLVTAIMIENSPSARPQSGLKEAGVVFEAIAEGGITRFVALYQESKPTLIGPVRSVRPYYVEWAAAFDPAVAHIGGSAKALQMIRGGSYGRDIDQFFNSQAYWRAKDRYAPHNVYTSFEKLDALNSSKGYTTSSFTAWPRVDGKKAETPNATTVNIPVSSGSYTVNYQYIAESNTYKRINGGAVHTDREKGEITPSVVIAVKVPMTLGFEDGYREQMSTIGSGQAYIFQNGTVTECTWAKPSAKEQITFKDAVGKQVPLARGQTWITALDTAKQVTWQ